jgi:hypothetical protein
MAPASVPKSISVPITPAVPITWAPAIRIIAGIVIRIRPVISGCVISDRRTFVVIPADYWRTFDDGSAFFITAIVTA